MSPKTKTILKGIGLQLGLAVVSIGVITLRSGSALTLLPEETATGENVAGLNPMRFARQSVNTRLGRVVPALGMVVPSIGMVVPMRGR